MNGRSRAGRTAIAFAALALATTASAQDPAAQDSGHVPPPPPAQPMPPMPAEAMDRVMDMHDDPLLAMFKLDQLERAFGNDANATAWDGEAWIGHDYDKLWLRSEGERERGTTDARIEAFWDHAFATWWDWQLGVRHDFGNGPQRDWAAFGIQGLSPYWFELEATAYVGTNGRTAARLRAQYELLLTQRLILQPQLELNVYGRRDPARDIGSGINDAELGVRLRYEFGRRLAPYVGIVRTWRGGSRDALPAHADSDTRLVAGVRIWF
jgi:copper resistance protein B